MKKINICLIPLLLLTASCSDQKKIDAHMTKYEQIGYQIGEALTEDPTAKKIHELHEQRLSELNALVALGALKKRTFTLEHIPRDSKREVKFEHEISARFQRDPIFPIYKNQVLRTNAQSRASHTLIVWDTHEQMEKWTQFIEEYDVPQENKKPTVK